MIWALLAALLLLLHTYFFYLLILRWVKDVIRNRQVISKQIPRELPRVSLVISAFNEQSVLEEKIANTLKLRYPADKFEVLIGSDGSKDRTNEILQKYRDQFRIFLFPQNRGKAAVLNDLVQAATGEILVFCDTNTVLSPTALEELTQGFDSPDIGAVNGRLVLLDSGKTVLGEGESLYWRIETEIKRLEADLDLLMGLNGAIYAIRRELFPTLPTNSKLMDDFYVCAKILERGYRSRFAPLALGVESTSKEGMGEFRRKVRIGQANFNYLKAYLPLINPKQPLLAFIFVSHKLLRWLSPFMLIFVFVLSTLLLVQRLDTYSLGFFVIQIYFYLSALAVYRYPPLAKMPGAAIANYFVTMNLALLIGSFQALFVRPTGGGWERVERDE